MTVNGASLAQPITGVSGIPGDGFPDFYYDPVTGVASFDSDGTDMTSLVLSGPDPDPDGDNTVDDNCFICDGDSVWDPVSMTFMSFGVGFLGDGVTWTRTSPLTGAGLQGAFDLALYETGLTPADFPPSLDDGTGATWQVFYQTGSNQAYLSNLTFVPEPATGFLAITLLFARHLFAAKLLWVKGA